MNNKKRDLANAVGPLKKYESGVMCMHSALYFREEIWEL